MIFWWIIFVSTLDHVLRTHSEFRLPSDDAAQLSPAQLLHADRPFAVVEHERHDVTRTMSIRAMRYMSGFLDMRMHRHHAHRAELHDGV